MKTLILSLVLISTLFTSCLKERYEANGNIVTEVRDLSNFSGVVNSGSKLIHVSYGPEYKVELRGSSNLIRLYRTRITNGDLNLYYDRINVRDDDIEVYITMPQIKRANLSGSGKIYINGSFPSQEYFESRISGSGEIQVYDGFDVDQLDVTISGSGRANLLKIDSRRAEVNISGSGEAKVQVMDHLKVEISGSGRTYYAGSPAIETEISGSGKVLKY